MTQRSGTNELSNAQLCFSACPTNWTSPLLLEAIPLVVLVTVFTKIRPLPDLSRSGPIRAATAPRSRKSSALQTYGLARRHTPWPNCPVLPASLPRCLGTVTAGSPRVPRRSPGSEARDAGPATVDVEAVGRASYSKRSIILVSQGQQDALPNRRRGIAEYLLPPIGGEANNSPNPLGVWERKETPLIPFFLPARLGGGRRPWPRQVCAPKRPQVPSGPSRAAATQGWLTPPSVQPREGLRCVVEALGPGAPRCSGLWARRAGARAGGGSSQAQAEGAARPRSRPPPGLGRKRGLRRGGAAAPGEAQGSRPAAAPVVAEHISGGCYACQARMALVSFSPVPARGWDRPEPTRVRLSLRLSLPYIKPPPPAQAPALRLVAPASATSRTQSRQSSLPASLDFPDGAMLFF
uniref:uncharacterized protein LOC132684318 n=1 Tax=Panthera onca TaxID=9690 RepID=UPI002955AB57|nr:uncharacterized protein LOC132684318 [Panthera onca]